MLQWLKSKIFRSSQSGRFVTRDYAERHPDVTERETVTRIRDVPLPVYDQDTEVDEEPDFDGGPYHRDDPFPF